MLAPFPAGGPARGETADEAPGWFAAGQEMAAALALLSDGPFKQYVFLCLNVSRHSAQMAWEQMELANLLHSDPESVTDALEELCRRESENAPTLVTSLNLEACSERLPLHCPSCGGGRRMRETKQR